MGKIKKLTENSFAMQKSFMPQLNVQNFPEVTPLWPSQVQNPCHITCYPSAMAWASFIHSPYFHSRKTLLVFPSRKVLRQFQKAFFFLDPQTPLIALEGWQTYPSAQWLPHEASLSERMKWLATAQKKAPSLLASTIYDLSQKTLPLTVFQKHCFSFRVQKDPLPQDLKSFFHSLGFQQAPLCEVPGTYCLRNGLFDVFSPLYDTPVRVELEGDLIFSLRKVDLKTQRSQERLNTLELVPSKETLFTDDCIVERLIKDTQQRQQAGVISRDWIYKIQKKIFFQELPFLLPYFYDTLERPIDYIDGDFSTVLFQPLSLKQSLKDLKNNIPTSNDFFFPPYEKIYESYENTIKNEKQTFLVSEESSLKGEAFSIKHSSLKESHNALEKLKGYKKEGFSVFIASPHSMEREKIKLILEKNKHEAVCVSEHDYLWSDWIKEQEKNQKLIHIIPRDLEEKVQLKNHHIVFLREKDFVGTAHNKIPKEKRKKEKKSLVRRAQSLSFSELAVNDYIIHRDHGIGIYKGLETFRVGKTSGHMEFFKIEYKDKDKLYVPVFRLKDISRYSGKPSLSLLDRLGESRWGRKKGQAQKQVESIAGDLLKLYAQRKESLRTPYKTKEAPMAQNLEAFERSFIYSETSEQLKATDEIFQDMERPYPMDRLLCGEVGSGKTEVALRAIFLAISHKKQVAVLVPTTLLSFQHLDTFKKRFHNFPIKVQALNRFVSRKDTKQTLQELQNGAIDVIIGTHRLLSSDVKFKDLGLLVVDEEQKFGVRSKEKIKKRKAEVDVLSLSATPIPRTLNLSLMGLRDLSLIRKPPPGRQSVKTFLCRFDISTIKQAIENELARGGQVFFVHNRIQALPPLFETLKKALPHVCLAIAHGQMKEDRLEQTMIDFLDKKIQVLLCTSLIESGIDIPQANTLIVDKPELLGLSQLYQLRGRVGRSDRKAYCYLLLPSKKALDPKTLERLKVIQENNSLGSGLQIAQYDLHLRGSGLLLGKKQHGLVESLGYEFFMELLEETLEILRGETKVRVHPEISLPISAYIPTDYIPDLKLRLVYYRSLSLCETQNDLQDLEDEMVDQFGKLPEPVRHLLSLSLITQTCERLGISHLKLTKKSLSIDWEQKSRLNLDKLIQLAKTKPHVYKMRPPHKIVISKDSLDWKEVLVFLESLSKKES